MGIGPRRRLALLAEGIQRHLRRCPVGVGDALGQPLRGTQISLSVCTPLSRAMQSLPSHMLFWGRKWSEDPGIP